MPTIQPVSSSSRQASISSFSSERVADLHGGAPLLRALVQLDAGEGGAVDAVAPGVRADQQHRVARRRWRLRADQLARAATSPTHIALTSGLPV